MRTLRAAGLTLEPQVAAHATEMFVVLSDPAIYEYENSPPASAEWLRTRFEKLESRRSADGSQQWLNWVLRRDGGALAGYVQATVHEAGRANIAYELSSGHWGKGLARAALTAMLAELAAAYGVREVSAVFKQHNQRSRRLLGRLGFQPADAAGLEPDEARMTRTIQPA